MLCSLLAVSLVQPGTLAFIDVDVIPMDRERVLRDQTVLVQGDRIVRIGDSRKVKPPAGARRIQADGKYLIPGLADMHVHLFSDDVYPDSLAPHEFAVMVANGLTTIRLMIGTPEHLELRKRIESGELLGPTLSIASPQLVGRKEAEGFPITTPEEAREAVRKSKAGGYDFIKITENVGPELFDAIVIEAKRQGIRVAGHVDPSVGVPRALAGGQHIEHLDAYMESSLRDDSPIRTSVSNYGAFRKKNWESLDYVDDAKIRALAQATAKSGTFTTPTLTFWKVTFGTGMTEAEVRTWPDYRFFPEPKKQALFAALKRIWADPPTEARRKAFVRARNLMVKEIQAAGGKIMAGSDTPDAFLAYGFTLHRELQNLVEAGLTPYQALLSATRTPAEFIGNTKHSGTVAQGKRADLVLLNANPLDAIANTSKIEGVMIGGRWLPKEELSQMLDRAADEFAKL